MTKTVPVFFAILVSVLAGCGLFVTDSDSTSTSGDGGSSGGNTETTTDDSGGSGGATTTTAGGSGGGTVLQPLVFEMSPLNDCRIVLGGDSEWQSFGSYTVTNPNDIPVTLDSVTLMQINESGDAADFVKVGVNSGPDVLGEGMLALDTQAALLDLSQSPLVISANSSAVLEMLGKMADVQPSSVCPLWVGCARSGHIPSLAVTEVTVKEGPISATFFGLFPPLRVLHKARPVVEFLAMNGPLHNGLNTIAKVRISTDPGYTITLRQLTLEFYASPELTVDVNGIKPWKLDGAEIENTDCIGVHPPTGFAQFCRIFEQYIPFLPNALTATFELRVNVSGVVSGSSIETTFFEYANEKLMRPLSLTNVNGGPGALEFIEGLVYDAPNEGMHSSSLLWSDLSEVPHDPSFPTTYDVFKKGCVQGIGGFSLVMAP